MKKYILKVKSNSDITINNKDICDINVQLNLNIYYKLIDDLCQQYNLPSFIKNIMQENFSFPIFDLVKYNKHVIIEENAMTLCITL